MTAKGNLYQDDSYSLGDDCISSIKESLWPDGSSVSYSGNVITPDGMVEVMYSDPPRKTLAGITVMRFTFRGRIYYRKWRHQFRPRYLTNLARRFAADVIAGEGEATT